VEEQEVRKWLRLARDVASFLMGATGFFYELILTNGERASILILSAGLLGVPLALRADESKKKAPALSKEDGA
jgi:hypothetical protein